MIYIEEVELHETFANNPSSLEGRLLFAVPKSESTCDSLRGNELTLDRGAVVTGSTQSA